MPSVSLQINLIRHVSYLSIRNNPSVESVRQSPFRLRPVSGPSPGFVSRSGRVLYVLDTQSDRWPGFVISAFHIPARAATDANVRDPVTFALYIFPGLNLRNWAKCKRRTIGSVLIARSFGLMHWTNYLEMCIGFGLAFIRKLAELFHHFVINTYT